MAATVSCSPRASPSTHHFQEEMNGSYVDSNQSQDLSEDQWRALATIIRDVGPTLIPDDELGDLAAAEGAVQARDAERKTIVTDLQDELRQLSKQHAHAANAAQRPSTHPTPAEHDAHVRTLEQQQYSVGKSLNEEKSTLAKKEVELGRVKTDREELSQKEVGEDDWTDGKAIRLKLLVDAGFRLIPPAQDGSAYKLLVLNDAKSDVHTVTIDKNRSRGYNANLIWSLASE